MLWYGILRLFHNFKRKLAWLPDIVTSGNSSEHGKTDLDLQSLCISFCNLHLWSTLTDGFSSSSNEPFLCISATFTSWSHPACFMPQVIAQTDLLPYRGSKCQKCQKLPPKFEMLSHIRGYPAFTEKELQPGTVVAEGNTALTVFASPHLCVLYQT